MSRPRLWAPAKGRGVEAIAFPAVVPEREPDAPRPDRPPMGYARRDMDSTAAIMRGTVAEMQHLAAAINPADSPEHVAHALQQVMIAAAQAIALAGRVRGAHEAIAMFEETP